ncbi:MAG: anti-anti-sigma factor [Deltaproteobacteria bacterium]
MHVLRDQPGVCVLRCYGELSLAELASVAASAARARSVGRLVVIDLSRVRHLHFAGARLLAEVPGLRLAGASRYLRDLVHAGGGFGVEFHPDVPHALRAG